MNGRPPTSPASGLGQTEPGSFVVNLRVPVSPSLAEPDQTHLFAPPFERRANRKLVAGLRAAREATDLVNRGTIFEPSINESRTESVRTCARRAAELIDVGGGLEVSVSWALTRPANEEHDERRATVTFQPADAPVLREAAQILGDRQERVDERIEGYVSALARAQSEPEGRANHQSGNRRRTDVGQGGLQSLRLQQDNESARPPLERVARRRRAAGGHRWHLSNPRDLTVMGGQ